LHALQSTIEEARKTGPRMDLLGCMRTFVRAVEAGSLSGAARTSPLSLAAVSRQVAALERRVGSTLIARSARKQMVTETGHRYYEHCVRVLREVEASDACATDGVPGLLTVTVPVTFGLARVSPHVPSLLAKHAGLCVDLRLEDRIVDLVTEGVDIAIRGGSRPPRTGSIIARPLVRYSRVLVASLDYLERHGEPTRPADIAKHNALAHVGASAQRSWSFRRAKTQSTVRLSSTFRSNAIGAIHEAALGGIGLALLPDWLVAGDVAACRLKPLLCGWEVSPTIVMALHRVDLRSSSRVKVFLSHLEHCYSSGR
jgi:DNA-binding transcriptional LysR family regulator